MKRSDEIFYFEYDSCLQRLTLLMRDGSTRVYGAVSCWTYQSLRRQQAHERQWYIESLIHPWHRIE